MIFGAMGRGALVCSLAALQQAVVATVNDQEQVGCTITAKACSNFPELSRMQFRDAIGEEHLDAGSNEAACLKRAEDLHHWCGNNVSGEAQIAATYNPKRWTQLYHPGACDDGWSQWDSFCYKYFWEMKTWPEAETLCRQRGSHLVSIHSQAENRFVANLQHGLKGWIGYSDVDKDTHYEWSDSTQDDFTNFAKNCTGRESEPDCKPEEVQQQWYSSSGIRTSPYTCKRNALLPGLALLKKMSAKQLTETPWLALVPWLASSPPEKDGIVGIDMPPLKIQEIPKVSSTPKAIEQGLAAVAAPKPRLGVPKGSLL
mmetsp:Transcript_115878/g.322641  ORF Transcript_115878/g.322641 Transcript_115878/m.322641 type:complete len:314 (-) Transcript_115878:94-1035(-)